MYTDDGRIGMKMMANADFAAILVFLFEFCFFAFL